MGTACNQQRKLAVICLMSNGWWVGCCLRGWWYTASSFFFLLFWYFYRFAHTETAHVQTVYVLFDSLSVLAAVEWSSPFDEVLRERCVGVSNEPHTHAQPCPQIPSNGIRRVSAGEAKLLFLSIRAVSRSDPTQRSDLIEPVSYSWRWNACST